MFLNELNEEINEKKNKLTIIQSFHRRKTQLFVCTILVNPQLTCGPIGMSGSKYDFSVSLISFSVSFVSLGAAGNIWNLKKIYI